MKKIAFVCPYFGKLPLNQMKLWLQSCERNPTIDWIIFTDDDADLKYPKNVKVNKISFENIKEYIQKKFEFKIELNSPYKLCDFKPTYGYVFSEYIENYDFWGYCDMTDCIFGNIRHFITDTMLIENDKIGFLGHLTLYKNCKDVNERFMLKTNSKVELRDILGNKENKAFDELNEYSINTIYNEYGYNWKRIDEMYVDISPMKYSFQAACYDDKFNLFYKKNEAMIFEWNNGSLYECVIEGNKINKREIMYVHFQKRHMQKLFDKKVERYYIVSNKFICDINLNDSTELKKITRNRIYLTAIKLKMKSLKYRIMHLMD